MSAETRLRIDRWSGSLAGAVVLSAAGVLQESSVLLVAAAIPVAYVVYGALDGVDLSSSDLAVEREIDRPSAFPGDRVDVTVRVTNRGDRPLSDLRVVDLVPEAVSVVDGRPRDAMALRPGETATLEYTVVARRGDHEFGPVRIRGRSTSGTDVVTLDVTPDGPGSLQCRPDLETVPLARQTRQFAGSVGTDSAGSGVEFHSTRDYQHGDPVNRVDWRRLAKTGDLTTVNYREHRTARVLVAVDARDPCYVSPTAGAPTGAAMCGYGARRVYQLLRAGGHEVGAAAFGIPDRMGGGGPAWVEPGADEETRIRARELFDTAAETPEYLDRSRVGSTGRHGRRPRQGHERATTRPSPAATADGGRSDGGRPRGRREDDHRYDESRRGSRRRPSSRHGRGTPERGGDGRRNRDRGGGRRPERRRSWGESDPGTDDVEQLCGRLSPTTQLLLFSPVVDEYPKEVVETVIAHGHEVTVVSPDVTDDGTTGGRIEAVERRLVLDDLRTAGATVVDWDRDRPLALTLASVLEGI